jgi:3-oxoacyl-(acyl-carrier-protein) synthase
MEAIFVLEALRGGWVPASTGAFPLDPAIGLNVPTTVVESAIRVGLSNSFAFGGSNVCLAFGVGP